MAVKKEAPKTKVVTEEGRMSYVNVFQPRAAEEGGKEKYSLCFLFSKKSKTGKRIKAQMDAAVQAAIEIGKTGKWGGKIPPLSKLKLPLRDGDEERPDDEVYAGMWFVNCSSDTKPGVVDEDVQEIISADEFYSGCYGKVSVNFYPFNNAGSKGVACGLNNVQKTRDGERLGGRDSAENDFGGGEEEDDELV